MRFYVVSDEQGQTVGCELTLKAAVECVNGYGLTEFSVDAVDCAVSAETVRRLLGGVGGYAASMRRVLPKGS